MHAKHADTLCGRQRPSGWRIEIWCIAEHVASEMSRIFFDIAISVRRTRASNASRDSQAPPNPRVPRASVHIREKTFLPTDSHELDLGQINLVSGRVLMSRQRSRSGLSFVLPLAIRLNVPSYHRARMRKIRRKNKGTQGWLPIQAWAEPHRPRRHCDAS
jgi:hypothetical protein